MRRTITTLAAALAVVVATAGVALANNPPGDPLPVRGEPDCFGARVSHSASDHGLTPKAKIEAHEANIAFFSIPGNETIFPWVPDYLAYFEEYGVSVRSIQKWIRIQCSADPIIDN